jgi:hypothetical protein
LFHNLFTFTSRIWFNIHMAEIGTTEVSQSQPTPAEHQSWLQKLNPFKKHPKTAAPVSPIAPTAETPMAPTTPMTPEAPAPATAVTPGATQG